jgi:hypothetical protein
MRRWLTQAIGYTSAQLHDPVVRRSKAAERVLTEVSRMRYVYAVQPVYLNDNSALSTERHHGGYQDNFQATTAISHSWDKD